MRIDPAPFDAILKEYYPASEVSKMLEVGMELPTQPCPPWWRFRARRRWIRDMNGRITAARIYGWRTSRGNARHHLYISKLQPEAS